MSGSLTTIELWNQIAMKRPRYWADLSELGKHESSCLQDGVAAMYLLGEGLVVMPSLGDALPDARISSVGIALQTGYFSIGGSTVSPIATWHRLFGHSLVGSATDWLVWLEGRPRVPMDMTSEADGFRLRFGRVLELHFLATDGVAADPADSTLAAVRLFLQQDWLLDDVPEIQEAAACVTPARGAGPM